MPWQWTTFSLPNRPLLSPNLSFGALLIVRHDRIGLPLLVETNAKRFC